MSINTIEDDMEDLCYDCPEKDVCVINPEEFEDECPRFRKEVSD